MSGATCGFECPVCAYCCAAIHGYAYYTDGTLAGFRLMCLRCEHLWDEYKEAAI